MATATDRNSRTRHGGRATLSAAQRQLLRRRLLAWYKVHARDLPWRRTRDPYHVWVSEIMLQQTQVATVRPYFERFIRAFPELTSLAAADEQQVLRQWEGLGYYRRARQLHAAAKRVAADFDGRLPQSVEELRKLPGIGRYTAGAIASIAFGKRAPILEANTIRLMSRLIGYRDDPLAAVGQQILWQFAEEILPRRNVAEFNQALMELGSLVCTAGEPKCSRCPLSGLCAAQAHDLQQEIPAAKRQQQYTEVREAAIIVRSNGRLLMRQCGPGERWAGLWDFPRFEVTAEGQLFAHEEIVARVRSQTGVTIAPPRLLKTMRHGVTRYRITLDCYEARPAAGRPRSPNGSVVRWIKIADLPALPLSTTGRRLAGLASKR